MIDMPEDYPWSSYRQKTGAIEKWVDEDDCYLGLSEQQEERQERYRQFTLQNNTADVDQLIRTAHRRGWLTGNNYFIDEIERRLGLRLKNRKQGRPRNEK